MRKRKRENTILRAYKYRVYPARDLPESFWQLGRDQLTLWNALVELKKAMWASAMEDETSVVRQERWKEFQNQARVLAKGSGLNWECWPDVVDRFCASVKGGHTPSQPQAEMNRIRIPHRWTAGGVTIAALQGSGWRLRLEPDGTCEFGLSNVEIASLRVVLHRPLPAKAILKLAALCGRKIPLRGWEWHLVLSLEVEPESILQPREACRLITGWTLADERVLVAEATDLASGEIFALALPLDMANKADRYNEKPVRTFEDLGPLQARVRAADAGLARLELRTLYRQIWERWTRRRRDIYRNYAAFLTRTFRTIEWSPLSVKQIAEWGNEPIQRMRQWSAPGDFQTIVKHAAERRGVKLVKISQTGQDKRQIGGLRETEALARVKVFSSTWNSKADSLSVQVG